MTPTATSSDESHTFQLKQGGRRHYQLYYVSAPFLLYLDAGAPARMTNYKQRGSEHPCLPARNFFVTLARHLVVWHSTLFVDLDGGGIAFPHIIIVMFRASCIGIEN
jgi:hypothetical protein